MPYGRKYRKSARRAYKKTPRSSRRTRYHKRRIPKSLTLRPRWTKAVAAKGYYKLTYTDDTFSSTLDGLNGYLNTYYFRGNGAYDPDGTGTGVQPYGYDALLPGLFNYYKVLASKITINWTTEDPVSSMKTWVIPMRNNGLTYFDPSDLMNVPRSKCVAWSSNATKGRGAIKHYASTKQIYNDNPSDTSFSAAYNGTPSTGWNWLVYFDTSSCSVATNVIFDCSITYYILCNINNSMNES